MSNVLKAVAVIGSTSLTSRTRSLALSILQQLQQHLALDIQLVELASIARPLGSALYRNELPEDVEHQLRRIENADLLLAASPVYRGAYPGLFKHLFDLIDADALINTPVLLAATGGSERHALMLEHQLRPLFGFLQALTLPIGVYATAADFDADQLASGQLRERIALAAQRAADVLGAGHSSPLRRIA